MKLSRYLASLSLCLLFLVSSITNAQTKNDTDDSDAATLQQKLAAASAAKMNLDDGHFGHSCSKKKVWHDEGPRHWCENVRSPNPDEQEQIFLRGCAQPNLHGTDNAETCWSLYYFYYNQKRYIEALAVLQSPNFLDGILPLEKTAQSSVIQQLDIYRTLSNQERVIAQLHHLCYSFSRADYCMGLKNAGGDVDMADAYERAHQADKDRVEQRAEQAAFDNHMKQIERQGHADAMAAVSDAVDNTLASIQQSQADMAQARVNATAIRLAQENKNRGPGGYSTTSSSGGSSGSGTSSTSSTHSAAKSTATASDSSDSTSSDSSSDSSTAASSSGNSFNAYSSTGGGYNPYSGQGGSSGGASTSGESGQWITTEITVTCMSRSVPHAFITAVLVSSPGNPNCNGALIEFTNPDKTHPFYYGFAGVANEQMEANTTKALSWGAPYLYKDMPNPPFAARVTIKYFAVY